MSWSIKLFKIKGIEIKVHLTFVLILAWAAYRWSSSTSADWQGALFGVVATLLLFTAVTLHELGHSFQALKFGVGVRGITLMPLGGVAEMVEIPRKPSQELRIALAGPLVNFTIAAVLVGLGVLLQAGSVISLQELSQSLGQASWPGMLAYLTAANLALGAFNLIPAFPMDGGRILRALLAMKIDYSRATAIAVNVGQGIAWALGLWGFMSGSYTLVLIAIFVWMGASQEGKQLEVKDALNDITVGKAMTRQPLALKPEDSLERAVDLILSTSQVDFPVLRSQDNTVAGLLGEAELLKGLRADGGSTPVLRYMRTQFPTAVATEPLFDAQQRMTEQRVKAMPVVDSQGRLAGLLTTADVNEAIRLLSASPRLHPAAGQTA